MTLSYGRCHEGLFYYGAVEKTDGTEGFRTSRNDGYKAELKWITDNDLIPEFVPYHREERATGTRE